MTVAIIKRSVVIAGRKTSFSVEDEFMLELEAMAKDRKLSMSQFVTEVAGTRSNPNLSSELRLRVLRDLVKARTKAERRNAYGPMKERRAGDGEPWDGLSRCGECGHVHSPRTACIPPQSLTAESA